MLRLLQGVGAAGLINLAVVIIGDHWEGAERALRQDAARRRCHGMAFVLFMLIFRRVLDGAPVHLKSESASARRAEA